MKLSDEIRAIRDKYAPKEEKQMSKYEKCSKEELVDMMETMEQFYNAYRGLIIKRGVMTEEELTKFDFSVCDKYAHEIAPWLFEKPEKCEA